MLVEVGLQRADKRRFDPAASERFEPTQLDRDQRLAPQSRRAAVVEAVELKVDLDAARVTCNRVEQRRLANRMPFVLIITMSIGCAAA